MQKGKNLETALNAALQPERMLTSDKVDLGDWVKGEVKS